MACPVRSSENDRWAERLCPEQKAAYFAFLKTLRIENPTDEGRMRGNKRYYKYARAAFLQGENTIDTYGPQYHETKASMGPRG
jgi:hypothetical protein